MKKTSQVVIMIIALILACLLIIYMGVTGTGLFATIPISWSFVAIGFLTFFGMYMISFELDEQVGKESNKIKNSIAGALLMVYIYLMAVYIFDEVTTMETEETKYIINNFTNLFEIVIVSYFGTSVAESIIDKKKDEVKK